MKYRYIITDEWDAVWGTNDLSEAQLAYEDGGNLVIDCETGEVFAENSREDIDPWQAPEAGE